MGVFEIYSPRFKRWKILTKRQSAAAAPILGSSPQFRRNRRLTFQQGEARRWSCGPSSACI